MSVDTYLSLSALLHSVWQSLGPFMSLQMAWFPSSSLWLSNIPHSVVFISAIERSALVIEVHIHSFPLWFYHRILNEVPSAIYWDLVIYPSCIQVCICSPRTLNLSSVYPLPTRDLFLPQAPPFAKLHLLQLPVKCHVFPHSTQPHTPQPAPLNLVETNKFKRKSRWPRITGRVILDYACDAVNGIKISLFGHLWYTGLMLLGGILGIS